MSLDPENQGAIFALHTNDVGSKKQLVFLQTALGHFLLILVHIAWQKPTLILKGQKTQKTSQMNQNKQELP